MPGGRAHPRMEPGTSGHRQADNGQYLWTFVVLLVDYICFLVKRLTIIIIQKLWNCDDSCLSDHCGREEGTLCLVTKINTSL